MNKFLIIELCVLLVIRNALTQDTEINEIKTEERQNYLNVLGTKDPNLGRIKARNVTLRGPLPDYLSWVERGFNGPIMDQRRCRSCYAFGSVAAIEGQYFVKMGKIIKLSEQNVVDCTRMNPYKNYGCRGGWPSIVFDYAKNKGVTQDTDYPSYSGRDNPFCKSVPEKLRIKIDSYYQVPVDNEEELKKALVTYGPISVNLDVSPPSFYNYTGGVYYDSKCNPEKVNHIVLLVGYGTASDGQDYWLVKNSWGTYWGEAGYMRLARNRNNHCGVARDAIYPVGISQVEQGLMNKYSDTKSNNKYRNMGK